MLKIKRQHGETWNSVPEIAGSRWGFIGAMAGVLVVLIIAIIVCVCVCRRRGVKKRMRHSAMGSDLAALHPTPSFGRSRKPGRQRTEDDEEADAFVASSPRQSLSYAGPIADERYDYNDNMRMHDINSRYYRGSEGFQQGYQSHDHGGNQFSEPEWEQQQQQQRRQYPSSGHQGGQSYGGQSYGAGSIDSGQYSHPVQPATAQYSGRAMGSQGYPSAPASTADSSMHAPYSGQGVPSGYPQEAYSQQQTYPQQEMYPQGAHQQPAYPERANYGQEYPEYSTEEHAPPSYPNSSNAHNHDMPKTRMGPAAV